MGRDCEKSAVRASVVVLGGKERMNSVRRCLGSLGSAFGRGLVLGGGDLVSSSAAVGDSGFGAGDGAATGMEKGLIGVVSDWRCFLCGGGGILAVGLRAR